MQGTELIRCKVRWSFYKNGLNKCIPLSLTSNFRQDATGHKFLE